MASPTLFLVIFSSLALSGLCGSSFSNQQNVKTIKTDGGVYDCVDFYKQPAFNHPLLKGRTPKVVPNLIELQGRKVSGIGLQDGGCPIGTVPILRPNSKNSCMVNLPYSGLPSKHCVALVHTNKLDRIFFGVRGLLAAYKPVINGEYQWSAARIKLSNVNESIEVGWMVNVEVFGDYEAHLYARFAVGEKGCINLQCSGFVQVSTDVPLGTAADRYSVIGGIQVGWVLSIDKHQDDGNWWITVSWDKIPIGYWPHELFTSLGGSANKVEWGGEIYDRGVGPTVPPPEMGSGDRASYDVKYSASIVKSVYVDETFTTVNDPQDTHMVVDCGLEYTVIDRGFSKRLGRVITYGGPK